MEKTMKDKMIVWCAATMCAVTAFSGSAPIRLRATDFVRATGNPSLVTWAKGSMHVPVWSLSGRTEGQSIAALTPPLPSDCTAVRVEIQVVNEDVSATNTFTDVYRAQIAQVADGRSLDWGFVAGKPVRSRLSAPGKVRTVVLETYRKVKRKVKPGLPLSIRLQREPDDPGDTFVCPAGLLSVTITPLAEPAPAVVVQDVKGYNSWPMIQTVGNRLVCTYSRGSAHTINEGARDAYARTSDDGGRTWSPEVKFAADPQVGEVMIGKGVDNDGAALFWVRCLGRPRSHHDLYRTKSPLAPRPLPHKGRRHVREDIRTRARPVPDADHRRVQAAGRQADVALVRHQLSFGGEVELVWHAHEHGQRPHLGAEDRGGGAREGRASDGAVGRVPRRRTHPRARTYGGRRRVHRRTAARRRRRSSS